MEAGSSRYYGLQELLQTLNETQGEGKTSTRNSWTFSAISPHLKGLDYHDLISKELEEEERSRVQTIPVENGDGQQQPEKAKPKEPNTEKNTATASIRNSILVGGIFARFSRDVTDTERKSVDQPKNPKNVIIKDYKTEMDEWQSKLEEQIASAKLKELEERELLREFNSWKSSLKKTIGDSLQKFNKDAEDFTQKGRFTSISNKDKLKKEVDSWSQNFTKGFLEQTNTVELEAESIRKNFGTRFNVLTTEVERIKEQEFETKVLEEVMDEVRDELTLVDSRILEGQLGILHEENQLEQSQPSQGGNPKPVARSVPDTIEFVSDAETEGDEDYYSCSEDEQDGPISPEKMAELRANKRKSLSLGHSRVGSISL